MMMNRELDLGGEGLISPNALATKECPKCGQLMLRVVVATEMEIPLIVRTRWRCVCMNNLDAGTLNERDYLDMTRHLLRLVNRSDEGSVSDFVRQLDERVTRIEYQLNGMATYLDPDKH